MNINVDAIGAYITNNFWYEKNSNGTDSSDSLLEAINSENTGLSSSLGTDSSSSYFDTVDISLTTDFFTKLKELQQNDPEKFQELFQKLGETLKNAKGYAGHILNNLSQAVADGADITDVIL
jgi:hypothetical protein